MSQELESNVGQYLNLVFMMLGIFLMVGIEWFFPNNPLMLLLGIGAGFLVILISTAIQVKWIAFIYAPKHQLQWRGQPQPFGKTNHFWHTGRVEIQHLNDPLTGEVMSRVKLFLTDTFNHVEFGKIKYVYIWLTGEWEKRIYPWWCITSAKNASFNHPNTENAIMIEGLHDPKFENGKWVPSYDLIATVNGDYLELMKKLARLKGREIDENEKESLLRNLHADKIPFPERRAQLELLIKDQYEKKQEGDKGK